MGYTKVRIDRLKAQLKKLLINANLFVIACVMFVVLGIPGFLYHLYTSLKRNAILYDLNYLFRSIIIIIDILGNVVCGRIFNHTLIKPNSIAKFGKYDETISSVLGKNQINNDLTILGTRVVNILDRIEPNHCVKWIKKCSSWQKVKTQD